jgi:hypothetical protein
LFVGWCFGGGGCGMCVWVFSSLFGLMNAFPEIYQKELTI